MEGYDGGKGFVGGDPSGEKRKAIQYGAAWSGRCVCRDGWGVCTPPPAFLAMGTLKGLGRRCVDH